jgi:SNF2 family DNA or RNA helicase
MPHQRTGGDFLANRAFALLADDPGLGKTAQAVHGADLAGCRKILVLAPAAVRSVWAKEFAAWQQIDRPLTVLDGLPKAPPGLGVTIASHEALAREPGLLCLGKPYDLIIVDESHAMRDWAARRTRHLYQPMDLQYANRPGDTEILHRGAWSWTTRLWCLTGTPVVNSAADLWPMFYGALRQPIAYPDFCARFAERMALTDSGEKPVGLKNAPELAERMSPFTLRRTLDSVGIKLPSLTMQSQEFALPPETLATLMAGLEGWSPRRLVTALEQNDDLKDKELMRVRRVLGLGKCLAVATYVWEQLTKHASGPVIVFFYHQDVRAELHRMLHTESGFRVGVIDGKTTPKQLAATEAAFQNGEYDILLAQIQSAGQGLTLHRSHVCCFAELPWTSTAVWQAAKRISRIGQTAACTATVLKVKDFWLEDVMAGIISKKQQASETLLNLLTSAA